MKSGFSNWIGILFTCFMDPAPNTGAASVSCPLAVSLSAAAGINPIAARAAIATTIPSTLPRTTPTMAIAYSSGYVRMRDVIKVGLIADTIRFALLIAIGLPLIKWFLAMRGFAKYSTQQV